MRQFETGSILKFIEQVFNLPPVESLKCNGYGSGYGSGSGLSGLRPRVHRSDRFGNDREQHGDVLDFSQSPRSFQMIPSSCAASCIESETLPTGPPDDK